MELADVQWTSVGPDSLGISVKEFQKLMLNLAEILRWVEQAAWRLHQWK